MELNQAVPVLSALAHEGRLSALRLLVEGRGLQVQRGGAPGAGRVQVLFSRPPRTADDELMRLAREGGAGTAVVSSDRRVQDAARRAGCAVLGAERFLDALAGAPAVGNEDEDAEERPRDKRGNPRRPSKKARAAARALRRLRSP